jgi:serine/threonine protein kinase
MQESIGHYNILERLGTGALGEVFRARDLKVGRTVALMVPPPDVQSDPILRERFLRDARAAAELNHPNIATLFDVLVHDGRCYLAYEFAAGPSLREEMGGRPVNMRRAAELGAQISDALAEGHARGLVHGDLRPENIVVTPKGSAKILNFGMTSWTEGGRARAAAASAGADPDDPHRVTAYLSPEQALGSTIDERSDIFSFGVILYEMLTGRNPFAGVTPSATVINVIRLAPPLPSAINPKLRTDFDALMGRLLAKPLEGRPQSAVSLSAELRGISTALDKRAEDALPPEPIRPPHAASSNRWLFVVAGIVLVVIVLWLMSGS